MSWSHNEYLEKKRKSREYRISPAGVRSHIISSWRREGLIHPDMYQLYDNIYLPATQCDVCHYVFDEWGKGKNWKCMDRDHDTNLFRQVLCNRCNVMDNWKKVTTPTYWPSRRRRRNRRRPIVRCVAQTQTQKPKPEPRICTRSRGTMVELAGDPPALPDGSTTEGPRLELGVIRRGTVAALRKECRAHDLLMSGTKAVLIERLDAATGTPRHGRRRVNRVKM